MESRKEKKNKIKNGEFIIEKILLICAMISILTTVAIVFTLFGETFSFFKEVSIVEFFTSTKWTPTLQPRNFGILPLLIGTMMIAVGSSIIALPLGLGSAIYLSEYAPKKVRKVIKPVLEILAGIPSIVYGFFALNFITPILQRILPETQVFNAASASIAVGIMIIPMVASLSEDAMMAVPDSIRQGAYALASTKFEVATRVIVPAALSSIGSAFVLAISRAIGETMIVAIAAGQSPVLTLNPLNSIQTMTGFMVNISLGDIQHGTVEYKTLFAVGALLFLITLMLNILARRIVNKYREEY
ncbi:phosphate ABC transporter permease subunit PstC [Alkaliphilus oremlandii]|uniref:Phosphate transport system permease protein n=1 Tax=Alkaliphilus oremlandii (strain OhILAs) TaxID=350688 RepID=A8MGW9_ALKOO|nr:phosphate ABC transporter permease subunit PstC [Alkaliphilus oremlandii]ABW18663.1 phosphate ABC transporter, inner membrane subunit PstC [Alkaliphilus oremlandii OhILAs]